ncbi:MAG: hypothetical protein ACHQDB_00230 [Steroidobacterales bacterium]
MAIEHRSASIQAGFASLVTDQNQPKIGARAIMTVEEDNFGHGPFELYRFESPAQSHDMARMHKLRAVTGHIDARVRSGTRKSLSEPESSGGLLSNKPAGHV